MIKYIGSKRLLIPDILSVIGAIQPSGCVIDLFSGTSRVGHALKGRGYRVLSNDHNAYAEALARCYVVADREDHERNVPLLIRELNKLPGRPGYFTDVFCERSRFFQPKNGARVDAIRDEIERKGLEPELKAILLVALMEAADRVDSTTGVQMAYLKQWAPRAYNDLELRVPEILPRARSGKGNASRLDAEEAVERLDADVCYLDPPYNQHKYLGNYHIWESLVLWDKPEVYGIACKRVDCRERGSVFNSKQDARAAMENVIQKARAEHLVVSFNNEGYFSRADFEGMLACRGEVLLFAHDYKRYVGAQIGIHNPKGEKVGAVSHLRNTEYIYVATRDQSVIERLRSIGGRYACELHDQRFRGSTLPVVTTSAAATPAVVRPVVTDLRQMLESLVKERGSLSSVEAQIATGADSGTLRAAFRALIAAGSVSVAGVARGTRYVWADANCPQKAAVGATPAMSSASSPLALFRETHRDLRDGVLAALRSRSDISSEDIRRIVTVDSAVLRVALKSLMQEGVVVATGQRRGTRYRLTGSVVAKTETVRDAPSEIQARIRSATTASSSLAHHDSPLQLSMFGTAQ